jgi:hypothetical protein
MLQLLYGGRTDANTEKYSRRESVFIWRRQQRCAIGKNRLCLRIYIYIMMNGAEGKSIFDLCNFLNRRNGHNDNIRGQQWSTFGDYSYVMGRGKRPRERYMKVRC